MAQYNETAEDWLGDDFELRVGTDGKCLMWWEAEGTWICSWPSEAAARKCILGSIEEFPARAGFDRSSNQLDIAVACHRYRERYGKFPQFEFDANATALDLYLKLDLGVEFVARLMLHEDGDWDILADWEPLVIKLLGGYSEPNVTRLMLSATLMTDVEKRLLIRWLQAQRDYVAQFKGGDHDPAATHAH